MSQSCKTGLVCRRELHILNLGAGVQSTAVYLLSREPEYKLRFDYAIFADTGDEPAAVYKHLEWLQSLNHTPILVRSAGMRLSENLIRGAGPRPTRPDVLKYSAIPAYTAPDHPTRGEVYSKGMVQRQCTRDFKIDVIQKTIKREVLGMQPRQRVPKGVAVTQYIGISTDEAPRAVRTTKRFEATPWTTPRFPLIDLGWSRSDCLKWLAGRVPHTVPRSACVFCPFHSNAEWSALKAAGGRDWEHAVAVDRAIRDPQSAAARGLDNKLYLHASRLPLEVIDFSKLEADRLNKFQTQECEGMCGL